MLEKVRFFDVVIWVEGKSTNKNPDFVKDKGDGKKNMLNMNLPLTENAYEYDAFGMLKGNSGEGRNRILYTGQ